MTDRASAPDAQADGVAPTCNDRLQVARCPNCDDTGYADHAGYSLDHCAACASPPAPKAVPETGEVERAAIVSYLRRGADCGADTGNDLPEGSKGRKAYSQAALAFKRIADSIEAGDHLINDALASPPAPSLSVEAMREALEGVAKFVDDYLSPWGSWKTAWWEGEVSDDAAFTDNNALKHVANMARRAAALSPSKQEIERAACDCAHSHDPDQFHHEAGCATLSTKGDA